MQIRRAVPNIHSDKFEESRSFFTDFLGMETAMEMDQIITFISPDNDTAQISILHNENLEAPHPDISIEVGDVDDMYAKALHQNIDVVYPVTNEPWGVRRFFVRGPSGTVINILSHL